MAHASTGRRCLALLAAGGWLALQPLGCQTASAAQDQAPGRREVTLVASGYRWQPNRIDADQDDLVRVTIRSEDITYSFAIDEYRIVRRVPAGGETTFEFLADRPGTFRFYSNLTSDSAHATMEGRLVVAPR